MGGLEFVEDVLYRLHHDGLQRARERVWIVRIVLPQHERRLGRFLLLGGLSARLTLEDEIRDRKLGRGCAGLLAFGRIVVFLSDVMEQPSDGVPDRVLCSPIRAPSVPVILC
jgi:hypothetical protein